MEGSIGSNRHKTSGTYKAPKIVKEPVLKALDAGKEYPDLMTDDEAVRAFRAAITGVSASWATGRENTLVSLIDAHKAKFVGEADMQRFRRKVGKMTQLEEEAAVTFKQKMTQKWRYANLIWEEQP
ncbi:hypothetical protein Pelo_15710 [Pelomyxa schiedti]|nr:hypothetical protein Pelo_15710 [Pelomyxa schiedti]